MTMMPAPQGSANTVHLAEIVVGPTQIHGLQGALPTAGSRIEILNMTRVERIIPTWAVVCATVGFLFIFVFSFLFLFVREDCLIGHYEIRVVNGGRMLVSHVPVQGYNATWIWVDLQSRAAQAQLMIDEATA